MIRRHATALLGLALLAIPATASAEWRRAESEHFVVYLVSDLGQLRRVLPWAREGTQGIYIPATTEMFVIAIRDGVSGDKDALVRGSGAGRVQGYDTARVVLSPLAGSPHGGPEAEAAQAMIKALPDEKPATEKKD